MFEHVEIAKQVYGGGTTSKITKLRKDANHASNVRKHKRGESIFPTSPEKGRAGKHRKKYAFHPSNFPTGDKTSLVHGPRHSMDGCKVIK